MFTIHSVIKITSYNQCYFKHQGTTDEKSSLQKLNQGVPRKCAEYHLRVPFFRSFLGKQKRTNKLCQDKKYKLKIQEKCKAIIEAIKNINEEEKKVTNNKNQLKKNDKVATLIMRCPIKLGIPNNNHQNKTYIKQKNRLHAGFLLLINKISLCAVKFQFSIKDNRYVNLHGYWILDFKIT